MVGQSINHFIIYGTFPNLLIMDALMRTIGNLLRRMSCNVVIGCQFRTTLCFSIYIVEA